MNSLKSCPLCGNKPNPVTSPSGRGRNRTTVYGNVCSNPKCGWSYAWTSYGSREEADKAWNEKVAEKEQMRDWDNRLKPCDCGSKAHLVFELYGSGYGLWFVRCEKCQKLLTASESMDAIIEAWNKRSESNA